MGSRGKEMDTQMLRIALKNGSKELLTHQMQRRSKKGKLETTLICVSSY